MKRKLAALAWVMAFGCLLLLANCAPAATPEQEPAAPAEAAPTAAPTRAPAPAPTPTAFVEQRTIELEWPHRLQLGESDVLRMALVPSGDGYIAQADFDEHPLETQQVPVRRPSGYLLSAIARLDGVGFNISPSGDQVRLVPVDEAVSWRWSLAPNAGGRQRLTISLVLRWEPEPGVAGPVRESVVFGKALEVQVQSILGMTRNQAVGVGLLILLTGAGLGIYALFARQKQPAVIRRGTINPALAIERRPEMALSGEDTRLMQTLFNRYARLVLESEFLSGYSGARTFLVRPIHKDGRADAAAIIKIGPRPAIEAEYQNYETYVKDRLPPITARIQHPPVSAGGENAAVQYTSITEPGRLPVSLRQALLTQPDPNLILRLFDTFAPNWWMQRQPWTFRCGEVYDRLLPPHLTLRPGTPPRDRVSLPQVNGNSYAAELERSSWVRVLPFASAEPRVDGTSWTLTAAAMPGQPPLRIRWLAAAPPTRETAAQIVNTRSALLQEWTARFDCSGYPDPLPYLNGWLQESIAGTRSTIHGDLNLENILVGPGNLVWLIDFAQTREGHPMMDFAHLASQLIAHVLAPQAGSAAVFLKNLEAGDPLLAAIEEGARRCLRDPHTQREFDLALELACLGALKYPNLPPLAKHCLYLTAARLTTRLM